MGLDGLESRNLQGWAAVWGSGAESVSSLFPVQLLRTF